MFASSEEDPEDIKTVNEILTWFIALLLVSYMILILVIIHNVVNFIVR